MRYIACCILSLLSAFAYGQTRVINLEAIRTQYHIPEVGYAVLSSEGIMELKVAGFHTNDSSGRKEAASPDDLFYLGNNTKAITAFIAARMDEDLKIKWLSEFFTLFPDLQKDGNKVYLHITLQQLMAGRAGIQPITSTEIASLNLTGSTEQKEKQLAKYLLKQPPVHLTGDKQYVNSDGNYVLAAMMLEKASKKTWQELVTECLNGQMGLHISFSCAEPQDTLLAKRLTVKDSLRSLATPCATEAASGLKMPLVDYAKFIQSNLKGLIGTDTMLTADTYRRLHFGFKGFSMGWNNGVKDDHSFSEHMNTEPGFYCYTLIDNTNAIAYIIVADDNNDNITKGLSELMFNLTRKYKQ